MTTDPQEKQQGETERLIAATREEAHKTRVLLVWLLVGLPVLAGIIWGLVALSLAHNDGAPSTPSLGADAGSGDTGAVDTGILDEPTTTTTEYEGHTDQSSIEAFTITDNTFCATVDDWYDTNDSQGPIDSADTPIYQGSMLRTDKKDAMIAYLTGSKGISVDTASGTATQVELTCAASPDETVLTALQAAQNGAP